MTFTRGVLAFSPTPPAADFIQQRPIKNFDSGSTSTGFYKEFAAHFADSDTTGVAVGEIVEWRKTDGTTVISSQADNFVNWPSGRLRTASFTMFYPSALAANGSDTLKGYAKTGSWNNTSWATTSVITALDIRAEITISGVTYTLGANNEIARGTNVNQVRSGPLNASWRIFGDFRNGTGQNDPVETDVWGMMYLDFFSDGTVQADCRIFSSRGNNSTAPAKDATSYKLKDYSGASFVFFSSDFDYTVVTNSTTAAGNNILHFASNPSSMQNTQIVTGANIPGGTTISSFGSTTVTLSANVTGAGVASGATITFRKIFYAGGFVDCCDTDGKPGYTGTSVDKTVVAFPTPTLSDPTTTSLYDAMLMWWIKWTPTEVAAMNPTATAITYTSMTKAEVSDVDQTGGSWWIGHMTARAVQAMALQSYTAMRQDRINALAEAVNSYWFLNALTGYPYNLDNTNQPGLGTKSPTKGWGISATISKSGGSTSGSSTDDSHAGQYAWYQWLLSGKEKYLDQIHGGVIGQVGAADPGTATFGRNPIINSTNFYASRGSDQARGFAWGGTRNKDNCEWATPAAHVMKPYLANILTGTTGQFAVFAARLTVPFIDSSALVLGVDRTAEDAAVGPNSNSVNSPWMHDYWAMQLAMSVRRGRITTSHKTIDIHVKLWCIGRGVNGCLGSAAVYNMSLGTPFAVGGPLSQPPCPASWSEVGVGNFTDTWTTGAISVSTASGNNVLTYTSTPANMRNGLAVTGTNIPSGTIVSSFDATTVTMSNNATGIISGGTTTRFYGWQGPITDAFGTGCPVSGITTGWTTLYTAGHSYPAIFQCMGVANKIIGVTGASSVVTYYDAVEIAAAQAESAWAVAPQWRIREPA